MPPQSRVLTESSVPELKCQFLFEKFIRLNQNFIKNGQSVNDLRKIVKSQNCHINSNVVSNPSRSYKQLAICLFICLFVFYCCTSFLPYIDGMIKTAFGVKCVLHNNYLVWEATRPVADCSICTNVDHVLFLENVTRESFKPYAYSYHPMVVKGAAKDWLAVKAFDYQFFKKLFQETEGAFESIEEECQFLNFKTDFSSLKEVFDMPKSRIDNSPGSKPWYIGWSNCHPEVLKTMRRYYNKPHFLPEDAEHSHVDFVFMGYQQGAFMHLDYISRLMWQAQLQGHKTWRLNPPPECEDVCKSHTFRVDPGDILLLDTRQWYHDTYVSDGEFSLTVSSEYG